MSVEKMKSEDVRKLIAESKIPVLVDFYADWCGPCKMIAPILEQIASENEGKLVVVKVDVDENQDIAVEYSVMSIPFVASFKDGALYKSSVGAVPKESLLALAE